MVGDGFEGIGTMKMYAKSLFILGTVLLAISWNVHASGYGFYHGYGHHGAHFGFRGHADGELALGLLAGALIGYAIANHHGYLRHPPTRRGATQVSSPPPKVDSSCLQEREYHTKMVIDGEQIPAWGIACLQTDGSWTRNGINLVP